MIRIALCDDEFLALQSLKNAIADYLNFKQIEHSIFTYLSGYSLLSSKESFDLIFLDIKMDGLDGMQTAKKLRNYEKNTSLIFVTALKDYVFEAFEVDAANYLLKPLKKKKLYQSLDKAIKALNHQHFLTLSQGKSFKKIKFSDILYCESLDHSVFIYTQDEIERYTKKFCLLETELNQDFFRCHRSYILNFNHLQNYQNALVTLSSGEKIPVAKRRQATFSKALLAYQRNKIR